MALAWSMQRPFKTSSIFGATTMAQLENSLKAADLVLSDEVMMALDVAGRAHPQPY
jgi:aryl-alcohol dehydrogenase-like predicted oxidoreductase